MEHVILMTKNFTRSEEPDYYLIRACQKGDRDAFRLLFEQHQDRVYSIALHYSGNDQTAHDIAQQVFLKLITHIKQYNFQAEFLTWLYRIVVNSCYDERRRWRRLIPYSDEAEVTRIPAKENIEADFSRLELGETVRAAISELKPKLRMPILLKYIEGLSYGEIGEVLGCSTGTVASRLNRGHKALANKLGHLRGSLGSGE